MQVAFYEVQSKEYILDVKRCNKHDTLQFILVRNHTPGRTSSYKKITHFPLEDILELSENSGISTIFFA